MRGRKGWFRKMAATGGMLLFLVALVAGVMRLPQVYGHYNDERTLNRPEYAQNQVNVYSYDYASVGEKLQDMMFYQSREIELTAMLLPSAVDTEVPDGKLRVFMQEELDQLYDLGILLAKIDLSQYVMGVRQVRSVYPGNGDRLKGQINFWEVTFERLENMGESILILADTDSHKIYMLGMSGEAADRNCFALQNRMVHEIKDNGRSEAWLAAELLDRLAEGFADYYGGEVPEENKERTGEAAAAEDVYGENVSGTAEAKSEGHDSYEDVDYLGMKFRAIIKDGDVGEWYLRLPTLIAVGEEHTLLPVFAEYAYDSDMLSIGSLLDFVYPDG